MNRTGIVFVCSALVIVAGVALWSIPAAMVVLGVLGLAYLILE